LTSVTLAAGVSFWSLSSLRFQAEMGTLIGLWLLTSALTSLFVMPSLVRILQPKFIFDGNVEVATEQPAVANTKQNNKVH